MFRVSLFGEYFLNFLSHLTNRSKTLTKQDGVVGRGVKSMKFCNPPNKTVFIEHNQGILLSSEKFPFNNNRDTKTELNCVQNFTLPIGASLLVYIMTISIPGFEK